MDPIDWLNKFYSFYVAGVADIDVALALMYIMKTKLISIC